MNNFLILYDIFDEKRLPKVAKVVYGYALGGQKSAIEAPLSKNHIKALIQEIEPLVKEKDKINIVPFMGKPILLGRATHLEKQDGGVIII